MVKDKSCIQQLESLSDELMIMVHLVKHITIVSLLAACTKDIRNGLLYVLVEYCKNGNLESYLERHRNKFIDQFNQNTGLIDRTINQCVDISSEIPISENGGYLDIVSYSIGESHCYG